jgi:hypothetical protein
MGDLTAALLVHFDTITTGGGIFALMVLVLVIVALFAIRRSAKNMGPAEPFAEGEKMSLPAKIALAIVYIVIGGILLYTVFMVLAVNRLAPWLGGFGEY